ncbi:hypothetical protein D9613_002031 [Agrocybe pediades]|uniref:SprT-like domain-containing protein n=1 Tax=Agrocybe pediades TaxID=84607 RepID=A0A8H4R5K9_9AGAR|nr:hypothetical protein D9613_002031 [Agrocybe pediades]
MVLQRVGSERANPEQNGYRTDTTVEVISDSDNDSTDLVEVEELCNDRRELDGNSTQTQEDLSKSRVKFLQVIEISSDSDDSEVEVIGQTPMRPKVVSSRTPRSTKRYYRSRIIESSEEDSEPEIIDLSDSSDDAPISSPTKSSVQSSMPPGSENESLLDDSIIIFDEPRSARKPLRVALSSTTEEPPGASHPKASPLTDLNVNHSVPLTPVKRKVAPVLRKQITSDVPDTPRSRSKKAQKEAEQKRLHDYAQQLFNDLNLSVFKQGLPVETKLNWNKRLLTTAGRAKFHRSRDGVQTTEIELAEKILDCEATWVIDKKVDEHHGKLFKSW